VPFDGGPLGAEREQWLQEQVQLLTAAQKALPTRSDILDDVKQAQSELHAYATQFAQHLLQKGAVERGDFAEFGPHVLPGIRRSLTFAAESQLTQFRAQISKWKAQYPAIGWDKAVVVVMAGHQPRTRYLQSQFFDWVFGDRPDFEDKVVFSEMQKPPAALDIKDVPQDAFTLLSKVLLDKDFAVAVFGDPYALQQDVLGAPAAQIIGQWQQQGMKP